MGTEILQSKTCNAKQIKYLVIEDLAQFGICGQINKGMIIKSDYVKRLVIDSNPSKQSFRTLYRDIDQITLERYEFAIDRTFKQEFQDTTRPGFNTYEVYDKQLKEIGL